MNKKPAVVHLLSVFSFNFADVTKFKNNKCFSLLMI